MKDLLDQIEAFSSKFYMEEKEFPGLILELVRAEAFDGCNPLEIMFQVLNNVTSKLKHNESEELKGYAQSNNLDEAIDCFIDDSHELGEPVSDRYGKDFWREAKVDRFLIDEVCSDLCFLLNLKKINPWIFSFELYRSLWAFFPPQAIFIPDAGKAKKRSSDIQRLLELLQDNSFRLDYFRWSTTKEMRALKDKVEEDYKASIAHEEKLSVLNEKHKSKHDNRDLVGVFQLTTLLDNLLENISLEKNRNNGRVMSSRAITKRILKSLNVGLSSDKIDKIHNVVKENPPIFFSAYPHSGMFK